MMYQIGNIIIGENQKVRVQALKDIISEDYRTALARNQPPMKKGEQGTAIKIIENLYGRYLLVEDDFGERRYLNGYDLKSI